MRCETKYFMLSYNIIYLNFEIWLEVILKKNSLGGVAVFTGIIEGHGILKKVNPNGLVFFPSAITRVSGNGFGIIAVCSGNDSRSVSWRRRSVEEWSAQMGQALVTKKN